MTGLYRAFGITIASEIPLVELPAGEGTPDVFVSISRLEAQPPARDVWSVQAAPDEVTGWAPAAGAFRVAGGRHIVIDPMPEADPRALRMAVVGPLLGVVLVQRGAFVLHASTVAIDGRAVAFAGPSGRGKSTMTAALTRRGHALIAEDMSLVEMTGEGPIVFPGFARLKLWPDAATALEHDVDSLPFLHPQRTKRSIQLPEAVPRSPVRLARCYLLEDGPEETVSVPSSTGAVLALVATTYQAAWLRDQDYMGANLVQCAALAGCGIVRVLQRRRSFAALDAVTAFIENDVGRAQY